MKCYTLLRDNTESGPYTLEEIVTKGLQSLDLVWVDGKFNCWQYPTEIEELKAFVAPSESKVSTFSKPFYQQKPSSISIILPPHYKKTDDRQEQIDIKNSDTPEIETKYAQSLDEIKEMYVQHLQTGKNTTTKRDLKNIGNLAALFIGLVLGAIIIKNIVESFDQNIRDTELANAAATPASALPQKGEEAVADETYQNAISTETVVLDTTLVKPVKKTATVKKENVKKLVSATANKYKVGVFGGINNLNITVNNRSASVLDKVAVEVSYLKQNGDVIKTENYALRSVAPKSVKVLTVPPSNRGVKIKYKITEIKSHPFKAAMVNA